MDFSKLPYDISKEGLMIEHYPELKDHGVFLNPKEDIYLRLAIAITDENSPFVRKEKQFQGIVESACDYLKITDKNFIICFIRGELTKEVVTVFEMQDQYFRMLNTYEYSTWYDLMYQYHENSMLIRTPLSPSDDRYEAKSKTKQEIRKYQLELQGILIGYENQIFPKGTNIKKVITRNVSKITTWPERMAKEYSAPE